MGRLKPLLPWFGRTLVEAQIDALLTGGVDEVIVVTGSRGDEVAPFIRGDNVRRVHNPRFSEGKTTSIKAGIAALAPGVGIIVLLAVDQPRPAWVVRRMLESHAASGAPATSPRHESHGGHPLVFDGGLRAELAAISEDKQGIREVMKRHGDRVNWVPFDSPIVRLDMNTPEAYERALEIFAESQSLPNPADTSQRS